MSLNVDLGTNILPSKEFRLSSKNGRCFRKFRHIFRCIYSPNIDLWAKVFERGQNVAKFDLANVYRLNTVIYICITVMYICR